MADDNKIYFDENGKAFTRSNSDTQPNNEGWEVWAESLPDVKVKTKQELPEGVWENYQKYQMLNNREGDWSAPEMKNPDALTKIRNLMGKVKDLPATMSYYAHKVADPMYANVDYMGQQVGDWAAKKINNIARAFDVSPEARQYGRFDEEEYDPEAVDVRFGRNAYKEDYDNLGDYLEAKDQEKVDRYRGYNHANRFAPIENADEQFYTLSDTQTMEDWQPETTSGKIAKGAIETAGNMLPENLKALMEEKGIEGGAKMLGALAPMYKRIVSQREEVNRLREAAKAETNPARKAKLETTANKYERQYFRDKRDLEEATLNQRYAKKVVKPEEYNKAKATLSTEEFDTYTKDIGSGEYSNGSLRGRFAPTHKKLEDYENQSLAKMMRERAARGENPIPEYAVDDLGEYTGDYAKWFESGLEPAEKKAIARSIRKGEPKPLPNPAKQSKAITRPSEGRFVPAYKKRFGRDLQDDLNYIAENLSPEELDDFIYKYRGYEPYQDFTGNTKARAELVNETVKRLMKAEAPMAQSADFKDAIQRAKNIVQDYGYEGESINKALENAIANRLANLTAEEISNYSLRPNTTDTAIYVANKAVEDLMDSGVIR